MRRHAQRFLLLLVTVDVAATLLALVAAYALRLETGLFPVTELWRPQRYLEALPPTLLLCVGTYALAGSYRIDVDHRFRGLVTSTLLATLLLAAGVLLYRDEYQYSRGVLVLFPFLAFPLRAAGDTLVRRLLGRLGHHGVGGSRVLLVGESRGMEALERELALRPWLGIEVVGRVPEAADLSEALTRHRPDQVFLAGGGALETTLARLEDEMIDVRIVPEIPLEVALNPEVFLLGGVPVLTLRQSTFYGVNRVAKRGMDLVLATTLLVLLSPALLLTGLAVLLSSGRPILYRQERMGLDGRRFTLWKFRSMRKDAEKGTGAVWAKAEDPRRTRIGGFLRRFSLDELPQLVNVIRGEMSLVGPRPERPVFIERFRREFPGYVQRLRIPAGLTGLAQVHGCRGDGDLSRRLRFDLEYLERWSILLDLEILVRTAFHVLRGRENEKP